jgi:hypothetical protein
MPYTLAQLTSRVQKELINVNNDQAGLATDQANLAKYTVTPEQAAADMDTAYATMQTNLQTYLNAIAAYRQAHQAAVAAKAAFAASGSDADKAAYNAAVDNATALQQAMLTAQSNAGDADKAHTDKVKNTVGLMGMEKRVANDNITLAADQAIYNTDNAALLAMQAAMPPPAPAPAPSNKTVPSSTPASVPASGKTTPAPAPAPVASPATVPAPAPAPAPVVAPAPAPAPAPAKAGFANQDDTSYLWFYVILAVLCAAIVALAVYYVKTGALPMAKLSKASPKLSLSKSS